MSWEVISNTGINYKLEILNLTETQLAVDKFSRAYQVANLFMISVITSQGANNSFTLVCTTLNSYLLFVLIVINC